MGTMEFEHIGYAVRTGKNSKQIETYNFHKAASVLAEYGFDCMRLADDWNGADFLAHHKATGRTLRVQLKTALVIDERYEDSHDLYMCFPLDRTGNWYLVKYRCLKEIIQQEAPHWLESKRWKNTGLYFSWGGNKAVRNALEEYAYRPLYESLGFREAAKASTDATYD